MVLKPWPLNVPVKAASGPRLGADEATALGSVWSDTSLILKPLGSEKADSRFYVAHGFSSDQAPAVHPRAPMADP